MRKIHIIAPTTRKYTITAQEIKLIDETLILASSVVQDRDEITGELTGMFIITDVWNTLLTIPASNILKITSCFATRTIRNKKAYWIRHPYNTTIIFNEKENSKLNWYYYESSEI